MAEHTPLPWHTRELRGPDEEIADVFVAAKSQKGDPYYPHDLEILGDDCYHGRLDEKIGDARLIVEAVNAHESLQARVRELEAGLQALVDWYDGRSIGFRARTAEKPWAEARRLLEAGK